MNTIGKILVVLNLIFALVVGGFLVFDFATRTNWKTSFESLKHEMEVAKTQTNISGKTQQELNTQVRRAEGEKADLQQKLIEHDKVAEVKLNSQKLMTQEANDRAKDADL